jgi:hypothetical protein
MTGPRTWTIALEPGTPILTANHRMSRYPAAARIKYLRRLAAELARQAKIPRLEYADILVTYASPPRLKRDRHPLASDRIEDHQNLQPTAKALVDGIADAKVFVSDSRKHVGPVPCQLLDETHPRGQVTMHITEVAQ